MLGLQGMCLYHRAEVLSLPQQPVLAKGVQSLLRHAVHRAFGPLLSERAHQQEQVLPDTLLQDQNRRHVPNTITLYSI